MKVAAMNHADLPAFIAHVMAGAPVIGPTSAPGHTVFAPLNDPAALELDYETTTIPPVRLFLPPKETLLQYDHDTGTFTPTVPNPEPNVLFGVHPCDLHGIALMDEIMSDPPADVHYMARRRATTIVGWDCRRPCHPQTLCYDKGTLYANKGFDLFGTPLDDFILWRSATAAGDALLREAPGAHPATEHHRTLHQRADREREARFTRRLNGSVEQLPVALHRHRNNTALWRDDIGHRCVSCGNCTMVCPTCYCFDVQDHMRLDLSGGERVRSWDSCQFHQFSAVASGEVFRETAGSREFHRVFKKEVYLKERFNTSGCVGCGRCNSACPAGISLIDIYNTVLAE